VSPHCFICARTHHTVQNLHSPIPNNQQQQHGGGGPSRSTLPHAPPPLCRHGTTTTTICSSTTSGRKACTARGGGRPRTGLHRRTQPHLYQHSPPLLLHAPPLLGYPSSSSSSHPTTAQPKTTTPLIFIYSCLQPLRRPRPRVPTTLRTLPRRQRSPSLHLSFPPHDDARPHPA